MDHPDFTEAARAAVDPNGPAVIASFVCPTCDSVHLAVVRGGNHVTAVDLTPDQGTAAAFELQAAAGAAFAGHGFLSVPRVSDGSLILSCVGDKVMVGIGHTARVAFTATITPDMAKGLATNVLDAVKAVAARVAEVRASAEAENRAYGHSVMIENVEATATEMAARGTNGAGMVSVGCACGSVHLFPVRDGRPSEHLPMLPDHAEAVAADIVQAAADARRLAAARSTAAPPPGNLH